MEQPSTLIKLAQKTETVLLSISRYMSIIAAGMLGLMMLLTTFDVAGRYFFSSPIKGAFELIGLMLVCAGTWGMAYCQSTKSHLRISLVFDMLPAKIQEFLLSLTYFISFCGIVLISWRSVVLANKYFDLAAGGASDTLNIPYFPFMLMMAVGIGMMGPILIIDLIRAVKEAKNPWAILVGILVFIGVTAWLLSGGVAISRTIIGILGVLVLLVLLFLGLYIGFALVIVGFIGFSMVVGLDPALSNIAIVSFAKVNSFHFAVIPLFLLMSAFVSESEIAKEAYVTVRSFLGHVRGGLAMATVGACGLFAACSGSSLAGAVTMGKVAYPEMKRFKYDSKLAIGCIAAGGTIGILIPPSIGFIIIGILTELSIGKLFMAGIIPGLIEIFLYIATIYLLCSRDPSIGPVGPRTVLREKIGSLQKTWPIILLFILILGGIYGGIFTPTEAGGIGAFGALAIGLIRRKLSPTSSADSLMETAKLAAMIIMMLIGAFMFNAFLAVTRIPFTTSEFISGLAISRYLILFLICIFYIILGMFFDIYAILILTIPIIFPTIEALGFHPLWYGVVMVKLAEIGLITPPFGINLFGLAGTVDIPIATLYRGIIPFFIADLVHALIIIAFPILSTYLPSLM